MDGRCIVRTIQRGIASDAAFENFLSPYGVTPNAVKAFEIGDGALPHIRIYDRDGKARVTFGAACGPFSPGDVERAVEKLLEEP